jgi:hypothetical protein
MRILYIYTGLCQVQFIRFIPGSTSEPSVRRLSFLPMNWGGLPAYLFKRTGPASVLLSTITHLKAIARGFALRSNGAIRRLGSRIVERVCSPTGLSQASSSRRGSRCSRSARRGLIRRKRIGQVLRRSTKAPGLINMQRFLFDPLPSFNDCPRTSQIQPNAAIRGSVTERYRERLPCRTSLASTLATTELRLAGKQTFEKCAFRLPVSTR